METPAPTWPLWDGQESVEQYAKRVGLDRTKTPDLGNGRIYPDVNTETPYIVVQLLR